MTQKLTQLQEAIREVCTELGSNSVEIINGVEVGAGGHSLHLEHILRAIHDSSPSNGYAIDMFGSFIKCINYDTWESTGVYYALALPLDQQASEVIDFLHSIICKG